MNGLAALFTITAIVGGSILVWLYTKSGKKWLKNL